MPTDPNQRVKDLFDLTGRVAIITGGAGLLGYHHGAILAAAGANIVLLDLAQANPAMRAEQLQLAHGPECLGLARRHHQRRVPPARPRADPRQVRPHRHPHQQRRQQPQGRNQGRGHLQRLVPPGKSAPPHLERRHQRRPHRSLPGLPHLRSPDGQTKLRSHRQRSLRPRPHRPRPAPLPQRWPPRETSSPSNP